MPDRFLPDYGLYLLSRGVRPETRLVFFELPVEHLTRPDLRTVSLTLSTEEGDREYAISFDFTGPRVEERIQSGTGPRVIRLRGWLTANRLALTRSMPKVRNRSVCLRI